MLPAVPFAVLQYSGEGARDDGIFGLFFITLFA